MRVISKSNASGLAYGGVAYEPGPDGVFDVPEPIGRELTTKHASMWIAEAVHLAAVSAAELDKLRNPTFLVSTVADLIGRIAALEASAVAAAKPKVKAPAVDTPPPSGGEQPSAQQPKKLTAAQKRAAEKKAAAAKVAAEGAREPDPQAEDSTGEAPEASPEPDAGGAGE